MGSPPFWVRRRERAEKGSLTLLLPKQQVSRRQEEKPHRHGQCRLQAAGETREPEIGVPGECVQGALVVCTVLESKSQGEKCRSLRDSTGRENPSRLASCHSPSPRGRPASSLPKLHPSSFTVCGIPRNTQLWYVLGKVGGEAKVESLGVAMGFTTLEESPLPHSCMALTPGDVL